jgi:hypothetical protein
VLFLPYEVALRKAYIILGGKTEGKRPFGRTTRRWEGNNIKMFRKYRE